MTDKRRRFHLNIIEVAVIVVVVGAVALFGYSFLRNNDESSVFTVETPKLSEREQEAEAAVPAIKSEADLSELEQMLDGADSDSAAYQSELDQQFDF